jgi:putative component of membrane protein insertase Oxa1/YidC/SpoIIIJ protein YidD
MAGGDFFLPGAGKAAGSRSHLSLFPPLLKRYGTGISAFNKIRIYWYKNCSQYVQQNFCTHCQNPDPCVYVARFEKCLSKFRDYFISDAVMETAPRTETVEKVTEEKKKLRNMMQQILVFLVYFVVRLVDLQNNGFCVPKPYVWAMLGSFYFFRPKLDTRSLKR